MKQYGKSGKPKSNRSHNHPKPYAIGHPLGRDQPSTESHTYAYAGEPGDVFKFASHNWTQRVAQ
jgi:hypothetical protein